MRLGLSLRFDARRVRPRRDAARRRQLRCGGCRWIRRVVQRTRLRLHHRPGLRRSCVSEVRRLQVRGVRVVAGQLRDRLVLLAVPRMRARLQGELRVRRAQPHVAVLQYDPSPMRAVCSHFGLRRRDAVQPRRCMRHDVRRSRYAVRWRHGDVLQRPLHRYEERPAQLQRVRCRMLGREHAVLRFSVRRPAHQRRQLREVRSGVRQHEEREHVDMRGRRLQLLVQRRLRSLRRWKHRLRDTDHDRDRLRELREQLQRPRQERRGHLVSGQALRVLDLQHGLLRARRKSHERLRALRSEGAVLLPGRRLQRRRAVRGQAGQRRALSLIHRRAVRDRCAILSRWHVNKRSHDRQCA
ncbi:MAG: hypothetical protein JWO86_4778 [Myxococcaceae bacterium]|nr:hypothetical protein [Myxococcaceae bacterium]